MVALEGVEEGLLVERAKQDPEAFGMLYDRYVGKVYRFAYCRMRNRSLAEDLTSEVFLKALKGIRSYDHREHGLSAWLYRITENAAADFYRKRRPEAGLEASVALPSAHRSPAEEVTQRDTIGQVWTAVDRLPGQQRTAMRLRFDNDLTNRQVGDLMGKSPAAVKLLLHRAIKRLRIELAAYTVPEVAS